MTCFRIEVCGGIASGKTTLCGLIRDAGWPALFEDFQENPFWALFYKNPQLYAFETEVTFLLQHYSQIKTSVSNLRHFVCDFALLQDDAYAAVNLRTGHLDAFIAVMSQVRRDLSTPSLVVHLVCDASEELARIRRRSRPQEKGIELHYLETLNNSVKRFVIQSTGCRILTIDSSSRDFANDTSVQEQVVSEVLTAVGQS